MSALFRATAEASFDRLYRRHAASIYRYAYAVLGNHADSEDVTQQTFLNAYRAIAHGTKPRKTENWLLTIAHNELRRHFRKRQGRPLEVELEERHAQSDPEESDPSVADVLRALQHLPPTQRAALVMREFEGRSYAEIAQILDVTQGALEGLIFRARRGLAEHLEGALTCNEAEEALLRRLDRRLPRREARHLKEHLRECPACVRFATVQKRQRSLLRGLSVLPIPASLYLFRGEQAAVAAGLGAGTAAGGTAAVGGGIAAKVAAVTATAAVVGGVGYSVGAGPAPAAKAERKTAHAAAVDRTRLGGRAVEVKATLVQGELPGPAEPASVRARRNAARPKRGPAARAKERSGKKKAAAAPAWGHGTTTRPVKEHPTKPATKKPAKSPRVKKQASPRRAEPKPPPPRPSRPENAGRKPADDEQPPRHPPPTDRGRGPKT